MKASITQSIQRLGIFIGGMRCGSTALNDYLKQHPEVCVHRKKDPHFFSGDDNWNTGWECYLNGWADYDLAQHKLAFESSTHYTKYPLYKETASRIASSPYDLRLIYGVRAPLARIESHFIHNAGKGYYDPKDNDSRKKLLVQAINVSNFDLQIQQYERYFSSNQLMIIKTEELIEAPYDVLKNVCRFLNIDHNYTFSSIPRRSRIFKRDVTEIRLTDEEREIAIEALREPILRFEERYQIALWDGPG